MANLSLLQLMPMQSSIELSMHQGQEQRQEQIRR